MKTEDQVWQLCPKCNGNGSILPGVTTASSSCICDVCHGQKIISRIIGVPPIKTVTRERPNIRSYSSGEENEKIANYPHNPEDLRVWITETVPDDLVITGVIKDHGTDSQALVLMNPKRPDERICIPLQISKESQ